MEAYSERFWSTDYFWAEIALGLEAGRKELPKVEDRRLLEMILKGWLALSYPAGHA